MFPPCEGPAEATAARNRLHDLGVGEPVVLERRDPLGGQAHPHQVHERIGAADLSGPGCRTGRARSARGPRRPPGARRRSVARDPSRTPRYSRAHPPTGDAGSCSPPSARSGSMGVLRPPQPPASRGRTTCAKSVENRWRERLQGSLTGEQMVPWSLTRNGAGAPLAPGPFRRGARYGPRQPRSGRHPDPVKDDEELLPSTPPTVLTTPPTASVTVDTGAAREAPPASGSSPSSRRSSRTSPRRRRCRPRRSRWRGPGRRSR